MLLELAHGPRGTGQRDATALVAERPGGDGDQLADALGVAQHRPLLAQRLLLARLAVALRRSRRPETRWRPGDRAARPERGAARPARSRTSTQSEKAAATRPLNAIRPPASSIRARWVAGSVRPRLLVLPVDRQQRRRQPLQRSDGDRDVVHPGARPAGRRSPRGAPRSPRLPGRPSSSSSVPRLQPWWA